MYAKRLRDVPLFSALGRHDIDRLAQVADEVDVDAGRVLTREGDFGREFFVVEAGTAEVQRGDEIVGRLGPGDFFGEIALIEEERRTATVTAATPMTLIVLTGSSFRALKRTMPSVYDTVKAEIAKRRQAVA